MTIKIIAVKSLNNGSLKAFVDLRVGDLEIYGCRVVQQSGKAAWISPPQREYQDGQGQRKWAGIVAWFGETKKAIEMAVLADSEVRKCLEPMGVPQEQGAEWGRDRPPLRPMTQAEVDEDEAPF